MDIDVNDIYTELDRNPAKTMGEAIFGNGGKFADEDGFDPNAMNGGIRDDVDGLESPKYNENNYDSELFNEDDADVDYNSDITDLTTDYDNEDGASLDADFYNFDGERVEKEVVETAVRSFRDMDARNEQLQQHIEELHATQEGLDEFYGIASLQLDEDMFAYQNALDSGRLTPVQYQEYSLALKQLERNKQVLTNKYHENLKRNEEDTARAQRIAFKDTVTTLKYQHKWQDSDFNDVTNFVTENGIKLKLGDISPALFIALRKSILFDRKANETKKQTESRVQKAMTGRPVRETKVPNRDGSDKRAAALRAAKEDKLSQKDMFQFLTD